MSQHSVRYLASLLLLASLLAAAPGGAEKLVERPEVRDAIALLDLWVEEQRTYHQLPGVAIGVVHDQQLVWSQGYGVRDLESKAPLTTKTIFRIGSVTKLFTAVAVLQLRDRGKFRLDDPVAQHLPWFSVEHNFEGEPEISIRHLLTHTSGLPREAAFPYWTTHVFPDREQFRQVVPSQRAIFPPAERYKYSNLGITLLGEIVAEVSGESYADYIHRHIAKPLGMLRTSTKPTAEHHRRMTTGYLRRQADGRRDVAEYYDTGAVAPAANIVSTIEDLARFAALQFRQGPQAGGKQILRGATLREMQRPHWVKANWRGGRGLGFSIARRDGKTIVSHGGWVAGHRTQFMLIPSEKIAVIAMTNADDGSPSLFANQAYDLVGDAIRRAVKPPPEPQVANPGWRKYLGTYTDPWGWEYQVLISGGQLVMYDHGYPPADEATSGLTRLTHVEGNTFLMEDGENVVFELDDGGRVERVRRRYEFLTPVEPAQ